MQPRRDNASSCVRPTEPDQSFLLASDVDGPLLGDEEGAMSFSVFVHYYSDSFHLALVTGRSLASVKELLEQERLPRPDYICSSVGSELFDYGDPDNTIGHKYAAQVSPEWDLEMIYALGEGEGIYRQEFPDGQPHFQAGFFWNGREETLAAFRERLVGQKGIRILPSYGQYIDVFPDLVGKGHVVHFLQRELEIDPARVVVAGDSGNDAEMFQTEYKGIVPANGLDEIRAIACHPRHYRSPFPAARGVIDGLRYFGFVEIV